MAGENGLPKRSSTRVVHESTPISQEILIMSTVKTYTFVSPAGTTALYTVQKTGTDSKLPWVLSCEIDSDSAIVGSYKLMRDAIADALELGPQWESYVEPVTTPDQPAMYTYEHTPADLVADLESWDWIRANGLDVPTITPEITPVNYAAKMSADLSPSASAKILPVELIACALLLIMVVIGSALVMPVAISFAVAAFPAIKLAVVATATTLISGSLLL